MTSPSRLKLERQRNYEEETKSMSSFVVGVWDEKEDATQFELGQGDNSQRGGRSRLILSSWMMCGTRKRMPPLSH